MLNDTDFADKGEVFAGAWSRITTAIATAHRHGLGVLIGKYILFSSNIFAFSVY